MLSKGLYITIDTEKIVFFEKVQKYIGRTTEFAIVTWVDEKGTFAKTLIKSEQFYHFIRLGCV